MPPFKNSRYAGSTRTQVVETSGQTKTFLNLRTLYNHLDLEDPDVREHTIVDGDDLDALALKYGGSESLWWLIAEVNELNDPFDLVVGQKLTIPSLEYFRMVSG